MGAARGHGTWMAEATLSTVWAGSPASLKRKAVSPNWDISWCTHSIGGVALSSAAVGGECVEEVTQTVGKRGVRGESEGSRRGGGVAGQAEGERRGPDQRERGEEQPDDLPRVIVRILGELDRHLPRVGRELSEGAVGWRMDY